MIMTSTTDSVSLAEVMDDSFVLVRAEWSMAKLLTVLDRSPVSHLIIVREEGDTRYHYLYSQRAARQVIASASPDITLEKPFKLHEYNSTLTVPASTDADQPVPDQVVVLDGERVVGFLDATELPDLIGSATRFAVSEQSVSDSVEAYGSLTSPEPFEAYPSLTAPDQVREKAPFDIFVGFRDEPDTTLEETTPILIEHPDPNKDCLVILSGDGVTVEPDHALVPLNPNAQARFSGTLQPGVTRASLKALFVYNDQVIGSARRALKIEGVTAPPDSANASESIPVQVTLPGPEYAVDLTVSIDLKQDGTLEWRLIVPGETAPLATHKLQTSLPEARQFAGDLMRDLRTQNFGGPTARNILETVGQQIADLLPKEFFAVLAEVHARIQRPPTLLWLTNEAYVPWELSYLPTPLDPGSPPFLGAQTLMGRWLEDPKVMLPPLVSLDVHRITAVASKYGLDSGQRELKEALAEQAELKTKWNAADLEATRKDMEALTTGARFPGHLVHFAVHGYSDPSANNQSLLLTDRSMLPASALTGAYRPGDTPRFSFVFLNACQVGTPGRSLGHAGGFPGVLIRGGTLGFIAPLWDVHDDIALDAAIEFYTNTLDKNETLGAALYTCRRGYGNQSATPLAYIYYGHPNLRLSRHNN